MVWLIFCYLLNYYRILLPFWRINFLINKIWMKTKLGIFLIFAYFSLLLEIFSSLFLMHLFFDVLLFLFIDGRSVHSFDLNMPCSRKPIYLKLKSQDPVRTDLNFIDDINQKLIQLFWILEIFIKKVVWSNKGWINVCLIYFWSDSIEYFDDDCFLWANTIWDVNCELFEGLLNMIASLYLKINVVHYNKI